MWYLPKDCPLQSDRLHFTAEGYRMFGKRYADVMLEQLGVIPVENRNYFIRYESHAGANLWDQYIVHTLPKARRRMPSIWGCHGEGELRK